MINFRRPYQSMPAWIRTTKEEESYVEKIHRKQQCIGGRGFTSAAISYAQVSLNFHIGDEANFQIFSGLSIRINCFIVYLKFSTKTISLVMRLFLAGRQTQIQRNRFVARHCLTFRPIYLCVLSFQEGKGVALKSCTQFLIFIKEAEADSDNE